MKKTSLKSDKTDSSSRLAFIDARDLTFFLLKINFDEESLKYSLNFIHENLSY